MDALQKRPEFGRVLSNPPNDFCTAVYSPLARLFIASLAIAAGLWGMPYRNGTL
jgi:hypothetical protein